MTTAKAPDEANTTPFDEILSSWMLDLQAANRSPRTLEAYSLAVNQLAEYSGRHDPAKVTRSDVRSYINHMRETRSPATARQRFASLRGFFRWLVAEGEIERSPMATLTAPKVAEVPPDVLTDDEIVALLRVTDGRGFTQRRDRAILAVLLDTGARVSEVTNLTRDDLDLAAGTALVRGKGGRLRVVPMGPKTIRDLDRYLRARSRNPNADLDELWIGKAGPMTRSGVYQMVRRRGREVGIENLHPHRFRHTFAHQWLRDGGTEQDAMAIAGWTDRKMLARYGASAASERAIEAQRRRSIRGRY